MGCVSNVVLLRCYKAWMLFYAILCWWATTTAFPFSCHFHSIRVTLHFFRDRQAGTINERESSAFNTTSAVHILLPHHQHHTIIIIIVVVLLTVIHCNTQSNSFFFFVCLVLFVVGWSHKRPDQIGNFFLHGVRTRWRTHSFLSDMTYTQRAYTQVPKLLQHFSLCLWLLEYKAGMCRF